jgi:hypothetical protein
VRVIVPVWFSVGVTVRSQYDTPPPYPRGRSGEDWSRLDFAAALPDTGSAGGIGIEGGRMIGGRTIMGGETIIGGRTTIGYEGSG